MKTADSGPWFSTSCMSHCNPGSLPEHYSGLWILTFFLGMDAKVLIFIKWVTVKKCCQISFQVSEYFEGSKRPLREWFWTHCKLNHTRELVCPWGAWDWVLWVQCGGLSCILVQKTISVKRAWFKRWVLWKFRKEKELHGPEWSRRLHGRGVTTALLSIIRVLREKNRGDFIFLVSGKLC